MIHSTSREIIRWRTRSSQRAIYAPLMMANLRKAGFHSVASPNLGAPILFGDCSCCLSVKQVPFNKQVVGNWRETSRPHHGSIAQRKSIRLIGGGSRYRNSLLPPFYTSMQKSAHRTPNPVKRERYLLDVPWSPYKCTLIPEEDRGRGAIPRGSTIFT